MNTLLSIDQATCIKCGKCVKVCPSLIFTQDTKGGEVIPKHIDDCIQCGHCVAVCPTNSVIHQTFPASKVHPIDYAQMPTPEQMLLLTQARRSNRAFSKKPIPQENLDLILEAAHRAPTASNLQLVSFTLVTDPEKLKQITDFTIGIFNDAIKKLENPFLRPLLKRVMPDAYKYVPTFHRLMEQHAQGNDLILRGATAAILIHTPKKCRFGCQDSNLAYQNGSLMAESLGVNQFYMGFVCSATTQPGGDKLAQKLGIDGRIHAAMALGMPAFRFPNYIDKKDINLTQL